MTLKHRMMMSAHGMCIGDNTGEISPRLHHYAVTRAHRGASMQGTESAALYSTSRVKGPVLLYSDAVVPSLRKLADAVHAAGSKLSITLWHGGHNVSFLEG